MGADSCGSNNLTWDVCHDDKVFGRTVLHKSYKTKDDGGVTEVTTEVPMLIGICGSFRLRDILQHLVLPEHSYETSVDEYMKVHFTNALLKVCDDRKFLSTRNYQGELPHSQFLVAYAGELFKVQGDFSVLKCPPSGTAIGSGDLAAKGALHILHQWDVDPETKVRKALEASEQVVISVKGPFYVTCI